jgi:AGZA family xanthine/uracil permease-like MFS transporter
MKIFSAPLPDWFRLALSYIPDGRAAFAVAHSRRFLAVAVGCLIYYVVGGLGLLGAHAAAPAVEFHPRSLCRLSDLFSDWQAIAYLPIAFPFALLTIIGGINNGERPRGRRCVPTRDILLTEAVATVVAALFGGVAQSTPYIGHPAYKAMGGRAAYTMATGLFIGIGGALGAMSIVVQAIPEAVITPILLFVGIEIVSQASWNRRESISPRLRFDSARSGVSRCSHTPTVSSASWILQRFSRRL